MLHAIKLARTSLHFSRQSLLDLASPGSLCAPVRSRLWKQRRAETGWTCQGRGRVACSTGRNRLKTFGWVWSRSGERSLLVCVGLWLGGGTALGIGRPVWRCWRSRGGWPWCGLGRRRSSGRLRWDHYLLPPLDSCTTTGRPTRATQARTTRRSSDRSFPRTLSVAGCPPPTLPGQKFTIGCPHFDRTRSDISAMRPIPLSSRSPPRT